MTPDQERWAEALAIDTKHDAKCFLFTTERMGACAMAGQFEGVGCFREIATRLAKLHPRLNSPDYSAIDLEEMPEEALLRAYQHALGIPGQRHADALVKEIERRGLYA